MTFDLTFTDPTPDVQCARLAMTRLEQHLGTVIGPLDPDFALASLAFAFLALEDVHPPLRPLPPGIGPSADPRVDLTLAIHHLSAASAQAGSAVEILRYTYTIRELRELTHSPHLAAVPIHCRHGCDPGWCDGWCDDAQG